MSCLPILERVSFLLVVMLNSVFFLMFFFFFSLLRESKLPKYPATAAVRTLQGGVKKSRKNKILPTLEPIFSGTKNFGGILIISNGGMGYGAPVEDGAPCQKSLVYIGGDSVKNTPFRLFLTEKKNVQKCFWNYFRYHWMILSSFGTVLKPEQALPSATL